MTHPRPPLVGRDPALAALRAGWRSAVAGRGGFVVVAGEPGIGKTALVAALAAEAADTGALVLWGQCWDGDEAPAYWPWAQVVREAQKAGGDPEDAQRLLPHEAASPTASTAAHDRFRLFDAVARLLGNLAGHRPVLVVLDDLQWADEGSLRLLDFASRHLAARPVLLLGAYREDEAGEALRRLAGTSEQVPLRGLGPEDVAALMNTVAAGLPDVMVSNVWRRTGGNPFLVRELTRLLVAQGDHNGAATPPRGLLDSVRDILERRLAHLSQPCADLLTVAAVAGPEVRVPVLARVADDPGDLPRLLAEAAAARVLAEPDGPARPYRFSHDLFRETILAGLPDGTRTRLHLAVGRALEALRDEGSAVHPSELAAHFNAAVTMAREEAVRYSMVAAEAATTRLAFEEARDHYERGLAALDMAEAPDPVTRLELLLRLGQARNRAGDAAGARVTYRDAGELARRLDDATSLARAAVGAHSLGWRTDHTESVTLLQAAVRALPGTPSALRARVHAGLARDLHHSKTDPDWDRARVLAEQAVADARAVADPGTLAFCLLALHDTRWRPGTADDRLAVVDELLAAAGEAGDRDLLAEGRLLRASALIERGDPAGPAELDEYCRLAERLGHARARYGALSRRATAALLAGRLADAAQLAEDAFEFGQKIGELDAAGVYETLLWAVRRVGGTWHTFRFGSDPWPGTPLAEAVIQLARGDLAAAGRALTGLRLGELSHRIDLEALAFAAEAVAAAGTAEQRAGLYESLRRHAGSHVVVGGCASYFGAVDHYLGLLARSLGRQVEARRHFETAAALHDRLGAPAWARLSRDAAGTAAPAPDEAVLRRDGDMWTVAWRGTESHLPDLKGLRDLAVLLARPGEAVHAVELHSGQPPSGGADAVLDAQAKAAYRRRLAELESDIDEADLNHDPYRAEKARAEREALIAELSAAVGLGGRDRRLGDHRERARKAVTARIREAIGRIGRTDPRLAEHLHRSVGTGTWCTYQPVDPIRWRR